MQSLRGALSLAVVTIGRAGNIKVGWLCRCEGVWNLSTTSSRSASLNGSVDSWRTGIAATSSTTRDRRRPLAFGL